MSEIIFSIWKPFIKSENRGERWLKPILETFDKLNPCNLKHENGLYHLEVDKISIMFFSYRIWKVRTQRYYCNGLLYESKT